MATQTAEQKIQKLRESCARRAGDGSSRTRKDSGRAQARTNSRRVNSAQLLQLLCHHTRGPRRNLTWRASKSRWPDWRVTRRSWRP